MGDVESMYYQVKVYEDDKDFQRFYRWTGGDRCSGLRYYLCLFSFHAEYLSGAIQLEVKKKTKY